MRNLLIALFLFACTIAARAQYTTLDELKKDLADHPKEDTARVNRLLACTFMVYFTVAERLQFAEEALLISRKINYPYGVRYALAKTGQFKLVNGAPEGETMMRQADSLAHVAGDSSLIAYLIYRRAAQLINRGEKAGLDTVLKAIKILENHDRYKILGSCHIILANNYQINYSNYPAAMEHLYEAKAAEEKASAVRMPPNTTDLVYQVYDAFSTLYLLLGDYDKALVNVLKAEELVKKGGGDLVQSGLYNSLGEIYRLTGKYHEALAAYNKSVTPQSPPQTVEVYESNLADVYVRMNNLPLALQYGHSALARGKQLGDDFTLGWIHSVLSKIYLKKGMSDSSVYHARQGLEVSTTAGTIEFMRDNALALSDAYAAKKDFANAYKYHQQYVSTNDSMLSAEVKNRTAVLEYSSDLDKKQAQISQLSQQQKIQQNFLYSSIIVLALILITAGLLLRNNRQKQKANLLLQKQKEEIDQKAHELEASYNNVELLGEIGRKITSSLSVEKLISTVYDNVNSLMDASVFGIGIYNEPKKQIEFPATYEEGQVLPFYTNSIDDKNRFAAVCLASGQEIIMGNMDAEYSKYINEIATPHAGGQPVSLIFLPLISKGIKLGVVTVQSFKPNAYSDYQLYMLRNIAVYTAIALENAESYEELNHTVERLKSTQAQLIQSEKMASLGELTAGIAHEIQNPLNFVNNFSEVSDEMINEMIAEINLGNTTEIKAIAGDVKQNLGKIIYHGKRADSIVKGMLQHTQSSTGAKEPTDINALTEEYIRLSYHGLRAKDKSFNATTKTEFDKRIGTVWVVPQDIGRVLLNLINNAYYTVSEKKRQNHNSRPDDATERGYDPTVTVTTARLNGNIEIRVKDNGSGIPQRILDKIFQPFFTTKPAGQGTGLGLSLAYDIITKGHDGELKVVTKEGEGSEFIIQLPDRGG